MNGMWAELGIAPTGDIKAIRRAYAARLRALNQDQDPQGFQRLREAYEWALDAAAPAGPDQAGDDEPLVRAQEPAQDAQPSSPEDAEFQALVEEIGQAMQAGHVDTAFDLYDQGSARGIFPLGYREYLLDAMMEPIVRDTGLSVAQFDHYLSRAGWRGLPASTESVSAARHYAIQRQEADDWFLRLQALANGQGPNMHTDYRPGFLWRWLPRLVERRNAALFFGASAIPNLTEIGAEDLRRKLRDYEHYQPWLPARIEFKDAARAQRVLEQFDAYGHLVDGALAFILGMLWLGREGHLEIVIPLVAAGAALRSLVIWRRRRRQRQQLKQHPV